MQWAVSTARPCQHLGVILSEHAVSPANMTAKPGEIVTGNLQLEVSHIMLTLQHLVITSSPHRDDQYILGMLVKVFRSYYIRLRGPVCAYCKDRLSDFHFAFFHRHRVPHVAVSSNCDTFSHLPPSADLNMLRIHAKSATASSGPC